MATLIQRVAQHAYRTFARDLKDTSDSVFQENVALLGSLLSRVTAKDVNFDRNLVLNEQPVSLEAGVAPVTYVHLWDGDIYSMGIFVLKSGARLPLHDHPGMFGLCRVIYGSVKVRSYSQVQDVHPRGNEKFRRLRELGKLIEAVKHVDRVVSEDDSCVVLTPSEGNIHEITAESGPAAFIDILAPPYDERHGARRCHYFRDRGSLAGGQDERLVVLEQVSQPVDYWCDSAFYLGPTINPHQSGT